MVAGGFGLAIGQSAGARADVERIVDQHGTAVCDFFQGKVNSGGIIDQSNPASRIRCSDGSTLTINSWDIKHQFEPNG